VCVGSVSAKCCRISTMTDTHSDYSTTHLHREWHRPRMSLASFVQRSECLRAHNHSTEYYLPCREAEARYSSQYVFTAVGSAECRDNLLAEELQRFRRLLQGYRSEAVVGAEDVIAEALVLFLEPADHCVGATYQRQAIIDPEIV